MTVYWRNCACCHRERQVRNGRVLDHRRYDRATGTMVPCPGSGQLAAKAEAADPFRRLPPP